MRQYKDSGIERIGKIPEEWEIGRIKNNIVFNPENTNSNKELEVSYMPMECLRFNHIIEKTAKYRDVSSYTPFEEGDIVMAKVTPCYENGNIAIAKNLKNGHGYGTSEIFVIRASRSLYTEYLFYYLYTPYVINRAVSSMVGTGGLKRINPTFFLNTSLLIPPVQEQQRIANYLDEKCGEIDGLIALQEKMILQLTDYKQSVITEAVTKGLNHNAKLVPSGIDWIGEIPEGWKVFALKWLMELYAGATPKSDNENLWDGDIPWITPADYKTEDIFVSGGRRNISQKGLESCATTILPKGSIIFSKRAPIGLVAINSEPLCTNQGCIGCIVNQSRALNKYYYYTLSIFKEQFELYGSGTTFKEISATKFADFIVPVPPLLEQQEIVRYLDDKCSEIDKLIDVKQQKIEKLKDYKKGVIYEAVTGKINIE